MEPDAEESQFAKYVVFGISILAVPAVLFLDYSTKGAILPHLPGRQDTWNVQYLLHFTVSILMIVILWVFRRRASMGKTWYWPAVLWNLAWAILYLYAVVSLWGEKY